MCVQCLFYLDVRLRTFVPAITFHVGNARCLKFEVDGWNEVLALRACGGAVTLHGHLRVVVNFANVPIEF